MEAQTIAFVRLAAGQAEKKSPALFQLLADLRASWSGQGQLGINHFRAGQRIACGQNLRHAVAPGPGYPDMRSGAGAIDAGFERALARGGRGRAVNKLAPRLLVNPAQDGTMMVRNVNC